MIKYSILASLLICLLIKPIKAEDYCLKKDNLQEFSKINSHIKKNPFRKNLKEEEIVENQKIYTSDVEQVEVVFNKPVKVTFEIEPGSEIEIQKLSSENCGPKIKLIKGKIISTGKHLKNNNCDYEIETNESYLEPRGTRYGASSKEISSALAELNGESTEEYNVDEGEIVVKLKKISTKSKIKFVKQSKSKNGKISKKVTKQEALSKKTKISLKSKSKMKLVKKGKHKTDRIAVLEVIEP